MYQLPLVAYLPTATILALALGERVWPRSEEHPRYSLGDWSLNFIGLWMQGLVVPVAGVAFAALMLRQILPGAEGLLPLGFWGAFALNFIAVDFLYYWQHRAMHVWRPLWRWHIAHHASPRVDVWASSRNSLLTNFIFVYFLVNPWLLHLCDEPAGFFAGIMATAALDVWRHARVSVPGVGVLCRLLSLILITPMAHHRHHDSTALETNFGANLSLWDRLFGTYAAPEGLPSSYQAGGAGSWCRQLVYPFARLESAQ